MSLIEVMVATGVFTVGMLGVFTGVTYASQQNSNANRMSMAAGVVARMRTTLVNRGYAGFEAAYAASNSGGTLGCATGGANFCLCGPNDFNGNQDDKDQAEALKMFFANGNPNLKDFGGGTTANVVRLLQLRDDVAGGSRFRRFLFVVSVASPTPGVCTVTNKTGCLADHITMIALWRKPGSDGYARHAENVTLPNNAALRLGEEVNF